VKQSQINVAQALYLYHAAKRAKFQAAGLDILAAHHAHMAMQFAEQLRGYNVAYLLA
jgi:hypothetical protein